MKKHIVRFETLMNILRAATVAAGIVGTGLALLLALAAWEILSSSVVPDGFMNATRLCVWWGLAVLAAICACCYGALGVFYRLCGRLRSGSAFTEENAQAMTRIARLFAVCGALLLATCAVYYVVLVAPLSLFETILVFYFLFLLAFAVVFVGVALLAGALGMLVRRAAILQLENDLTI